MSKLQPAVFFGRDGVLNKDIGTVTEVDDFEFIEGAIEACILLKKKGYLLVLVTNQPGIARGELSEDEFLNLTEWMDWSMADRGVDIDGIYYCPHHKTEGQGEYKVDCACRKPKTGMFDSALAELPIDITQSIMVAVNNDDVDAASAVGIGKCYLISNEQLSQTEQSKVTAQLDDLISIAESI